MTYSGKIERIESLGAEALHYYSARGEEPASRIAILLDQAPKDTTVHILVMGLYRPTLFGAEGDSVEFKLPRHHSLSGNLSTDEIVEYKVVHPGP